MRGQKMMIPRIQMTNLIQLRHQTSDADNHAASNFRLIKKPKLQMKRKSAGKNQDVANAEFLQSIGEKLGQKQKSDLRDEDELFGALIASQMRQIAPERKAVAKMQISNIVCQEMLAPFNSGSWKYPQQQMQELHQAEQHEPQEQQHQQHRIVWSGIRTKSHFRFLIY